MDDFPSEDDVRDTVDAFVRVVEPGGRSSSPRARATPSRAPARRRAAGGAVTVRTIGHGRRPLAELLATLHEAGVRTLVDVRRFPGSRANPQFNGPSLAAALEAEGIAYRHAVELGGRRAGEPGEERFGCIRVAAFRSYAARMGGEAWQAALAEAVAAPAPCLMCSETLWWRCHRRLIAELLHARGVPVEHLLGPGKRQDHRPWSEAESRDGRLYLCGALVA